MIFLFSLLFCFALSGQTNVITWASAHLHVLSNLNLQIAVCTFRLGFPSIELLESLYESVAFRIVLHLRPDVSGVRKE
jgi:hypothetical protein